MIEYEYSDTLVQQWEEWGKLYRKYVTKLKGLVLSLVKTRNQIFTVLKDMQEFDFQSGVYRSFQMSDYLKHAHMAWRVKGTAYVDTFALWGLKKRNPSSEIYKNTELSE